MKKLLIFIILFQWLLFPCSGKEDTAQLRMSASILPRAVLEVSAGTLSFFSAGEDMSLLIPAGENEIEIIVRLRMNQPDRVSLAVVVPDDLLDPSTGSRIPVDSIHWSVPDQKGLSGKLVKGVPQVVTQWDKSGLWKCKINFFLENREEYVAGNYTQKIIFSLLSL